MKEEVLHRIHSEKYHYQMSYNEYARKVSLGLQQIDKIGVEGKHLDQQAVNLALEYNMELMFDTLMTA